MRAFVIKTDGVVIEIPDPGTGTLKPYYQHIETNMVEPVTFKWGTMWCDEEGKMKGRGINGLATRIFHQQHGPYDVIVGHVVCRVKKGRKLDWIPLPADEARS